MSEPCDCPMAKALLDAKPDKITPVLLLIALAIGFLLFVRAK